MKYLLIGVIAAAMLVGCDASKKAAENTQFSSNEAEAEAPKESSKKNGETINLEYMDQTVRPQDDFFMFANGACSSV